jgi:hypothetical protein
MSKIQPSRLYQDKTVPCFFCNGLLNHGRVPGTYVYTLLRVNGAEVKAHPACGDHAASNTWGDVETFDGLEYWDVQDWITPPRPDWGFREGRVEPKDQAE